MSQALVSPDQISTFSNIYRHKSPLLTLYHLIPSSTNLYWPSTSQYRHILTQYHQVPLIIHHLVRHSSVNWIISLFTTHLMSHAQYTWSSYFIISSSSKKKSPSLAAENKLFYTLIQSWILSLGIFHRWDTTSWMAHPCVLITIYLFSALRQLHQKEGDRKFKVEKLENQLKPKIFETESQF